MTSPAWYREVVVLLRMVGLPTWWLKALGASVLEARQKDS